MKKITNQKFKKEKVSWYKSSSFLVMLKTNWRKEKPRLKLKTLVKSKDRLLKLKTSLNNLVKQKKRFWSSKMKTNLWKNKLKWLQSKRTRTLKSKKPLPTKTPSMNSLLCKRCSSNTWRLSTNWKNVALKEIQSQDSSNKNKRSFMKLGKPCQIRLRLWMKRLNSWKRVWRRKRNQQFLEDRRLKMLTKLIIRQSLMQLRLKLKSKREKRCFYKRFLSRLSNRKRQLSLN